MRIQPIWFQENLARFNSYLDDLYLSSSNSLREYLNSIRNGKIPRPFSIEIHPHLPKTPRCINDCVFCTGQEYGHDAFNYGITEERFKELVYNITQSQDGKRVQRVANITFSGNCTEPLLYPNLHQYIGELLNTVSYFILYTNMILGTQALFKTLADSKYTGLRVLRTSLNAATPSDYLQFHRPNMRAIKTELERLGIPLEPGEHIFNRILNNIENIVNLRNKNNARSLCLYINYLLYPGNDREDEIKRLIDWADGIGLDYIKFRIPQIPQLCQNSINHLEKGRVHELERVLQEKINTTNFTYKEIPLNDPLDEAKQKPFSLCWTRFSHAVIGCDGGLYPCTSVASPSCDSFAEGNINQSSFWEIWNNSKRLLNFKHFNPKDECDKKLFGTDSPAHVCTLVEFAFNQYFFSVDKQQSW